jgi:hypothetical protein
MAMLGDPISPKPTQGLDMEIAEDLSGRASVPDCSITRFRRSRALHSSNIGDAVQGVASRMIRVG